MGLRPAARKGAATMSIGTSATAHDRTEPGGSAIAVLSFALAVFVSAFLLFQVQPVIGKYILPWFGGAPGVWTTCMLFFQVLLLGGYAYAHVNMRWLGPRAGVAAHLLLLALAMAMLPITPGEAWKPPDGSWPTLRILMVLGASVAVPYLALAATGPLLQAWFSRLHGGRSPYRLFALSNLGSLLGLVSYPFLVEPAIGRAAQTLAWSWGLAGFAVMCAGCAVLVWRHAAATAPRDTDGLASTPSPEAGTRVMWFALPACASVLLLATTSRICQDIAVVPFLWVVPLALYLLSFVVAFDRAAWYHRGIWGSLMVLAGAAAVGYSFRMVIWEIAVYCAVLFTSCMVCHGELARLKPPPSRLTEYYLTIAAGGGAGGAFVALAAPVIFPGYYELQIAMMGALVLLLASLWRDENSRFHRGRFELGWYGLAAVAATGAIYLYMDMTGEVTDVRNMHKRRNFYGVLAVYDKEVADGVWSRTLRHGLIIHGTQLLDPDMRGWPTAYYGPASAVGQVLAYMSTRPLRIGVVGLGAGTMAAHGRAGDRITFYEINPLVVDFARRHFTFLSECKADVDVVLGDGRLSLERQDPQNFDLLVLDAFSGDAIPVHLLTLEAFEVYLRHLKPDGAIAIHISNKHLDLRPALAKAAERLGLAELTVNSDGVGMTVAEQASQWTVLSRDRQLVRPEVIRGRIITTTRPLHVWTDDYASLMAVLQ